MDVISEIQSHRGAHCGMKDSLIIQDLESVRDGAAESSRRGRATQINVDLQANFALETEAETKFGGESTMGLDSISETNFRGASARETEYLPQTKFGGAFATLVIVPSEKMFEAPETEIEAFPKTKFEGYSGKEMEVPLHTKSEESSTKRAEEPLIIEFGEEYAKKTEAPLKMQSEEAYARKLETPLQTKFGGPSEMNSEVPPERDSSALTMLGDSEEPISKEKEKQKEDFLSSLIISGNSKEAVSEEPLEMQSEEAYARKIEVPLQTKFGGPSEMNIEVPPDRDSSALTMLGHSEEPISKEKEEQKEDLLSSLIISENSKGAVSEKEEEEKEKEKELISSQIMSVDWKEVTFVEEEGEGILAQRDLIKNSKSKAVFGGATSSASFDSLEIVSEDSEEGAFIEQDEGDLGSQDPLSRKLPQSDLDRNTESKAVIGEASSSTALDSKFTMLGSNSLSPLTSKPILKKDSSSKSLDSRLPPRKESSSGSLDSKLAASVMRRKKQLSVTVFERLQQDPLLAEHFAQLETPTAEPVQDCNSHGFGPRQSLKSTRRLKCTTDSVGIKYLNQYIVIKVLGRGTFGKVKLCLNTMDCKLYAVKILHRKWVARQSIGGTRDDVGKGALREIAIMKKLHHPNVVSLVEVIDDPTNRKLYLVLEYVEGGPILENDRWHPIPEEKARLYFRDMCQGLDYLHFNNIVHRDLKPGNLLQTMDGRIKISDFGVSHVLDHESDSIHGTAGTPAFLAPEICSGGKCQGRAADIWALGVCLYVMVSSQIPFPAETVVDMYRCIIDKKSLMLTKDPNSRISLAGIMQHNWVSNHGTQPLVPFKLQRTRLSTSTVVSEDEVKAAVKQVGLAALSNVEPVEKHFEPGEYIMRQGEEGQEMYLINSGECEVLVESRSLVQPSRGRMEYAIAERGPGQYVGEMALSTDTTKKPPKRTASIRAKTHVVTLVVSRDQVMEVLSKNSEAAKSIADTIVERDREMRRRMRALELKLPSFKPSSLANEQGSSHRNEEESTKVPVLENGLPSRIPESDKNMAKRKNICLGCRFSSCPSLNGIWHNICMQHYPFSENLSDYIRPVDLVQFDTHPIEVLGVTLTTLGFNQSSLFHCKARFYESPEERGPRHQCTEDTPVQPPNM